MSIWEFAGLKIWEWDALILVDPIKTFSENEEWETPWALMVPNTRGLAEPTNKAIEYFKNRGWIVLTSIEEHELWHISFASSFEWKESITVVWQESPKWFITYDEVKDWTDETNGLTKSAMFTVEQLQDYLEERWTEALWPDHAVEWTWETEFITWLNTAKIDEIFIKWYDIAEHTYSAFEAKTRSWEGLEDYIKRNWIKRVFVWSLATDFCVWETWLDSAELWFTTYFIDSISRGVYPKSTEDMLKKMEENWIEIIRNKTFLDKIFWKLQTKFWKNKK